MGPIGMQEMIALFVIALLLFGPKKLPELGRTLGKALTEFRRAKNELKTTFESHMQELERETRLDSSSSSHTSASYTYPYDDYGRYDGSDASSTSREPSEEQKAAIEANANTADPASYGLKPDEPAPSATPVAGTIPRNNGVHPVTTATEGDHRA
ncbi:MAG: twin-arginine translocase TatA/TatE family subunit [Bryobacteraceae bacterium]